MRTLYVPLMWVLLIGALSSASPAFAAEPPAGGAPDPLEIRYDTAAWAVVVFVLLLLILRKTAWGPILEGL